MDKESTRHYTSRRCSRAAGGVCTGWGGQASSCSQVWYPCRAGAGGDAGVLTELLGTVLQQHLCRQAHAQSRSCITVYGWWGWLHRVCGHWGVQRDHITFAGASPPHAHSCPTCALRPLHWCWWPGWEVRGAGGQHPATYSSCGPGPTGRGGWLQLQPRLPGCPPPCAPAPGCPRMYRYWQSASEGLRFNLTQPGAGSGAEAVQWSIAYWFQRERRTI